MVLADPKIKDEDLPRSASRPYPSQYVSRWKVRDGTTVVNRPIRPEDEPLMVRFDESLSEESVYLRSKRGTTVRVTMPASDERHEEAGHTAIRGLLQAHRGWTVVGEAKNGLEAVEKAKMLKPDVAILDFTMPKLDGLQATRQSTF